MENRLQQRPDPVLQNEPFAMQNARVTDAFWREKMRLVRNTVLPHQWKLLNDAVPGAAKSYCIHNFRAAAEATARRKNGQEAAPHYTDRGFEVLPDEPDAPQPDRFYGFVFQDSDLYKWLEAVAYALADEPNEALEAQADAAIDLVCQAQQADGYLDTYYILNGLDGAFTNLKDHHELYCFGHLAEAAVAYAQVTGKTKLLEATCRWADLLDARFSDSPDGCQGYPGHPEAELALFRLFAATGCARYRDLALRFLNRRGQRPYYFDKERGCTPAAPEEPRYTYYQAHLPVREQHEAVGHAVRAMYLYSGMADAARLTGDAALLGACRVLFEDVTARKMYVTGGVGSTADGEAFTFAYDLPNDTAYAETCAAAGLVFFARRMLQIEPRAAYADVMERVLYNGLLSGMSADGKRFFYVNPLEVDPAACTGDPRKRHVHPVRQAWFGCACCPPNLARVIGSVGQYAWTKTQDTLFVHLHIGGEVLLQTRSGKSHVLMESEFPWEGNFSVRFPDGCGDAFTLAVRIPAWCAGQYTVEGAENAKRWVRDGYLYLQKAWSVQDALQFNFAMHPQFVRSDARVRENIGKVALARGPLVYCMEEADNGEALHLCTLDTAAGIDVSWEMLLPHTRVPVLTASGFRICSPEAAPPLYAPAVPPKRENARYRFIPYYLWANRTAGEMQVWTRAEGNTGFAGEKKC